VTDTLWLDTETFSEVDLKKAGTPLYAQAAEIMLFQWAFNDEPAADVDFTAGEKLPNRVIDALADERVELKAHNAYFDRTIMNACGYPTDIERWFCTMAQALAHGLPGALEKLGVIVGLKEEEQKSKDGAALIQMFCKPTPKGHKLRRRTRLTHPEEWARFRVYGRQDVEAMRFVSKKLPTWNYRGKELALWHLDQAINDHGFAVDVDLARAAIRAGDRAIKNLAQQVDDITMGDVASATKRDALLKHILEYYGVTLPDMKADTLKRRVEDPELPEAVRTLLRIRLEASMTTKAKYGVLTRMVSPDGRMRNTTQFAGAARTRRWSGKGFQPQNLKRPNMPHEMIDLGIEAMKADCEDLVFPNVMSLTANAARGCIIAEPGNKLNIADLSNIEGRMLAFLAGEKWKLKAFADFDAGVGHDLYKLAYARSFNVDPATVGKGDKRQIGKVQELALGYQGGVAAFVSFAMVYQMDLDAMAKAVIDTLPDVIRKEAEGMWSWAVKKRQTIGLTHDVYVACDALKRMWREAHKQTTLLWAAVGDATRLAIRNPGIAFEAGRHLKVQRDANWLRVRLPSGNCLCYVKPECGEGDKGEITYMGINPYTRQWKRVHTHGGKIVAEATQSSARDVLAENMPAIYDAGYRIVLGVHDELITETPDTDEYSSDTLAAMMATVPSWAPGLPLAAAGFETYRYRKD
jgi:DNA polymerase